MIKLTDLIERDNVDVYKLSRILAKGLDNNDCKTDICRKVYKEIYSNHLDKRECDCLIDSLYQGEKRGSVWTLEDTNTIAKKLGYSFEDKWYTPEEFRAAIHVMYYDVYFPLKDSNITLESSSWGRLGDFYFTAEDEKQDRLVDYYFDRLEEKD